MQAKDLEVDTNGYQQVVGLVESMGNTEDMERRSRSLGMRSSMGSRNNESVGSRRDSRKKHDPNSSLVERHIERSADRTGTAAKGRPSSRLSGTGPGPAGFSLINQAQVPNEFTIGGGLMYCDTADAPG